MSRRRVDLAAIERQRLLDLERQAKAKAEAAAVASGIAETACLEAQRGVEYLVPEQRRGEREKPIRRMTGLQWLHAKGRINDDQLRVGEIYGAVWRIAHGVVSIRSHLDVGVGGQPDRSAMVRLRLSEAEARVHARQRLEEFRARLFFQADLIEALNVVAGAERTPREATANGPQATALETLVKVALDLLDRWSRGGAAEAA